MEILDGKQTAKKIREGLKVEVEELKKQGILPKLAVIMVGDNPASKIYVRNKSKACEDCGIVTGYVSYSRLQLLRIP